MNPPHGFERHRESYRRVLSAKDHQEIEQLTAAFARTLGFDHHAIALRAMPTVRSPEGSYRFAHNLEGQLGRAYDTLGENNADETDPRLPYVKQWLPPIAWNSLYETSFDLPPDILPSARKKLDAAREQGIHSGITLPLRAPGIDWGFITFSTTSQATPRALAPRLLSAAHFAQCVQAAGGFMDASSTMDGLALTSRETEALRWSAIGKTSWEIALILQITERTVNHHLQRAASKLGVKGRGAAVAQALARGLIQF